MSNPSELVERLIRENPWTDITDAYSVASWVPETLRLLISDRPERRRDARDGIVELMYHQGTPCDGTSTMLVMLVRLAGHPDLPDRPLVMRLVGEMLGLDEYGHQAARQLVDRKPPTAATGKGGLMRNP